MRRGVKRLANHKIDDEQSILDLSVYEYFFHLESLKDANERNK